MHRAVRLFRMTRPKVRTKLKISKKYHKTAQIHKLRSRYLVSFAL